MKFFAGHFVLDADEMISTIKKEFERYEKRRGLVVFVFCPKTSKYYKQIESGADFWNRYSDRHVTILFPGYVGNLSCEDEPFQDVVETAFDYDAFVSCHTAFEKNTTWEYQGGTNVLAMTVEAREGKLRFDYGLAIAVDVERLDANGGFDMNQYLIELINAAKASPEQPFERLAQKDTIAFIVSVITSALPKQLASMLDSASRANLRRPTSIAGA